MAREMEENNRLKRLLRRNHMSQQEFAEWFGITRYTAWQILNQKRQLKADEIIKICMRFDVTADWLLELSDYKDPYMEGYNDGVKDTQEGKNDK